jgi:Arc/MetJ family transcription regulator
MRTNIVIDDSLMKRAMVVTGIGTKKQIVEVALKLMIKVKGQSTIRKLRGKLNWDGNLDSMRKD